VAIASGANIARAPAGAYLHKAFIADKAPKGAGSSSGGGKNEGRKGGNTTKGGEKGGDLETLARMQREFAAYIKTHASMADPPSVGANTKVVWL